MATAQIIIGYSSPTLPAKQPLEYISRRLFHGNKITTKNSLHYFTGDSDHTQTQRLFGNLFEKNEETPFFERMVDRVKEWNRWFEITPWNEIFGWNQERDRNAMVHPE